MPASRLICWSGTKPVSSLRDKPPGEASPRRFFGSIKAKRALRQSSSVSDSNKKPDGVAPPGSHRRLDYEKPINPNGFFL